MPIRSSKPHATDVAESTFLLCKPDAEQHHRYILQTVSNEGFRVLAKRFTITPALAEEIASTFQSVRQRMYAERGDGNKCFSLSKNTSTRMPPGIAKQRGRVEAVNVGPNSSVAAAAEAEEDVACGDIETIIKRQPPQGATYPSIMTDILRLTRLRAAAGEGVNAGLTDLSSDDTKEMGTHETNGAVGIKSHAGGERSDDDDEKKNGNCRKTGDQSQHGHDPHRRVLAAAHDNTLLATMSSQDLLKEHVRHLAFGGTCMAIELSRQNAVERLLEIVGPENPADARRAAPRSIRASLGRDVIRNAVHAASNLAEASHCISAVFGFQTRYSAADVRAHSMMQDSAGAKIDGQAPESWEMVRPRSELVVLPHRIGVRGVTSLGSAFRISNANPQAHISYYTGRMPHDEEGRETSVNDIAAQHQSTDAHSWKKKAESLEEQLAQERAELATTAKLLHAREMDLLLRERAIESATCGFSSSLQLLRHQQAAAAEAMMMTTSKRQSVASLFSTFENRLSPTGALPSILRVRQLPSISGPLVETPNTRMPSNSIAYFGRHQSTCMTPQRSSAEMPVIEGTDVSLLLSKPVRLRALFLSVKGCSVSDSVMWDDMMHLYSRSPVIQLSGLDNHHDFFSRYMMQHTEEPLSFDSFVFLLMFLLKQ